MRDILADLERWQRDGAAIALATVVQAWGSSPRLAGAKMAMTADGQVTGSVSGGCVENAVFEAGAESLSTKRPQLLHFGVADETAWSVGLACGGSIDIFVKPLDESIFENLKFVHRNDEQALLVTIIRGPDDLPGRELLIHGDGRMTGTLGQEWDAIAVKLAHEAVPDQTSRRVLLNEDVEIFIETILPPPTLMIIGGVHIAVSLATLGKMMGFRTVLVDPRGIWGNMERFPDVDRLIKAWPDEAFEKIQVTRSTAIVMLTHDPKLDDPAIKHALNSPAFYVGALGSKTTNAKRHERLLNDGVIESQLSRLHAPIGLDIGASTPEEIALAVMSEVVKSYRKQNQPSVKNEAKQSLISSL